MQDNEALMERVFEVIEQARADLAKSQLAIDLEEARNGDTEFLDLMIHELHWMLSDHMVQILTITGGADAKES